MASRAFKHKFINTRSRDRKSTRLNSSHANISYAVFCLKQKINNFKIQLGLSVNANIVLDDREPETLRIRHPDLPVHDSTQTAPVARRDYVTTRARLADP